MRSRRLRRIERGVFGHTAPQFTLPLGCRARIDAESQRFEVLEAAVE